MQGLNRRRAAAAGAVRALAGLGRVVLPPACPVSGERVSVPGTLAPHVWAELRFITRPLCPVTGLPLESVPNAASLDLTGQMAGAVRPPYGRARSALVHEGPARQLVHLLKYGDRLDLVPLMARWMRAAGAELLEGADLLVPVPLHRQRLLARRFNQAASLASALAEQGGIAEQGPLAGQGGGGPAYAPDVLVRVRATPSQVGLSGAGRRRNVAGAFRLSAALASRPGSVAGRRIVLVDDVMTSGATAEACTRVLLRAGAARVDVLTLARVVGPLDATV